MSGDAIAEYLKVFKSIVKFYGKCLLIPEGKEVPSATLGLFQVVLRDRSDGYSFEGAERRVGDVRLDPALSERCSIVETGSRVEQQGQIGVLRSDGASTGPSRQYRVCIPAGLHRRIGKNSEADDVLMSLCMLLLSLFRS